MGSILGESGTEEVEVSRKVAIGRTVAGFIRSLVNAISLHLECTRVLAELLLVLVLAHGNEAMIRREKEMSRIRMYGWTT